MDSGRWFRALVTGIMILFFMWALHRLETHRNTPQIMPADTTHTTIVTPAKEPVSAVEPSAYVEPLPLVALDNTCSYTYARDLSHCTGTLSGGPAREYRIAATDATPSLYVKATPRAVDFDLSFALMTTDERCVAGHDDHGPGITEQASVSGLSPGEYWLVVGGYADECGPYELTVRASTPNLTQVVETGVLAGPNGKVVRWGTFAEVDVQHYVVYRTSGEERKRVAVLRAHGSPAGFAKYRVMDRHPQSDSTYEIEAVAPDGRSEWVSVGA